MIIDFKKSAKSKDGLWIKSLSTPKSKQHFAPNEDISAVFHDYQQAFMMMSKPVGDIPCFRFPICDMIELQTTKALPESDFLELHVRQYSSTFITPPAMTATIAKKHIVCAHLDQDKVARINCKDSRSEKWTNDGIGAFSFTLIKPSEELTNFIKSSSKIIKRSVHTPA